MKSHGMGVASGHVLDCIGGCISVISLERLRLQPRNILTEQRYERPSQLTIRLGMHRPRSHDSETSADSTWCGFASLGLLCAGNFMQWQTLDERSIFHDMKLTAQGQIEASAATLNHLELLKFGCISRKRSPRREEWFSTGVVSLCCKKRATNHYP
ncbi:hypothetical protein GE09DRAFT_545260 [Coniochaeta sp. 2T2.1]|nr:hypothetical protein GE09DRAFT_545260 [Coniochaeta sp. 2T2.1]